MKINDFRELLESENLVEIIENGQILDYTTVIRNYIKINTTNKQALFKMEGENMNMLSVVNRSREFIGVITKEEIMDRVLKKIIQEEK